MSKKILAIVGSARIGGNTELLVDSFLEGAAENGHEITKFHLGEIKVNGCLGCGQCYKNGIPCVQKDDMQLIYPVFDTANVIVWASPLYYRHFTAQMFAVIDRLHTLGDPEKIPVRFKDVLC